MTKITRWKCDGKGCATETTTMDKYWLIIYGMPGTDRHYCLSCRVKTEKDMKSNIEHWNMTESRN